MRSSAFLHGAFAALFSFVIGAHAAERTLTVSGVPVTLQDLSGEVDIFYSAMRFNRALNAWNVEVTIKNRGARSLNGPFALYVESFSGTTGLLQPDGMDGANAYLDLGNLVTNSLLAPSQSSAPRTLTLGVGSGTPQIHARVYGNPVAAAGYALALSRSLNEIGQPLPEVTVLEVGPEGSRTNATDSALGLVTLGQRDGAHVWKFTRPGYLPVWRRGLLQSNEVAVVPNPRLTPRGTNSAVFTPIAGGTLTTTGLQINFGPGAFAQNTTGTVTRLTGQTLPAFLPLGWSPLQAFHLDLNAIPNIPATASLTPWSRIAPAENAALVRWNELELFWDVIATTNGSTNIQFSLPGAGAFAIVVADTSAFAPPTAQADQPLQGTVAPFSFPTGLSALGSVTPSLSPASRNPELVTANAEVTITNTGGALPSGIVLRCDVSETYDLADDTRRVLPRYESFIVAYQRPGDANANTVVASFPMRPMLLLGGDELKQGNVRVDVIEPTSFGGSVFDTNGGQVAAGGVRILAPAGVFTNRLAIDLRLLDKTNFVGLAGSNLVYAFELSLGELPSGRRLIPQFGPLTPDSYFVLARVLSRSGLSGLEPIERFVSDATGKTTSIEPTNSTGLPGLTSGGQFVLLRVPAPQGLVQGIAGNIQILAVAGIPVRITGQPWLTFSRDGGAYRLIAPTGNVEVVITDLVTGDSTVGSVAIANWQSGATLNITAIAAGPRVVSVSPANGSTNVARVTPVTITFSEPVNIGSAVGGIVLLGVSNQPVNATLSFNLKGNVATLLATDPLGGDTVHQLWLSTNVSDLAGYKLEGTNVFVFKTQTEALDRGPGAQLVSHEPTNGVVFMRGSQGMAESRGTVILVNETSGRTTTVIANTDGSFEGTIPATIEDRLVAVFVNGNGTRNTIPVTRQIYADGRVGLFSAGGVIEAQTPDGPAQLIVEPNAIPNKTILKVDYIAPTNFPTNVVAQPPNGGKLYGALHVVASGDEMKQSMDVVLPVKLEDLGLPAGEDPTNGVFALVIARQITDIDGESKTVYEIVDRMHYEDGKLVTHSPPFAGLLTAAAVGWDLIVYASLQGTGGNLAVAGRVFAAVLDGDGKPIASTRRFLPGAVVNVIPPNSSLPGLPGRLRPGSMFAYANGTNAQYAAMVPVVQGGSTVLQARHPAFPGQVATLVVPTLTPDERFIIGNTLFPMDLVFPLDYSTRWDVKAPSISFAHSPQLPGVGTNNPATLRVVAVDNLSRPSLSTEIEDVISLSTSNVLGSSVTTTIVTNEDLGTFGRRISYQVQCPAPARVVFKSTSSDDNGNDQTAFYSISFGINPPAGSNNIPIIDPNDRRGPTIIASEPSRGARSVAPGQIIKLTFNEPVDVGLLQMPGVINVFPETSEPGLVLSDDQRELSVTIYDLKPDTDYTLTLSGVKDLNGNPLDQDPTISGNQSYTLSFHTAALTVGNLGGINSGGGVVTRGIYAYALDRQTASGGGAVKVYDLSIPSAPENVATMLLPNGYPRDLLIIPQYSFKKRTNDQEAVTKDLLVVVGGLLGNGRAQYLRIYDISSPRQPELLLGRVLSFSPDSAITRVQWSAPHLGYLDSATVPSVSLVNLQTLILSEFLTADEFKHMPDEGYAGVDANGDGDYVDTGEELPLPARFSPDFAGKITQLAFGETDQTIRDFALEDGGGFVGVIADQGHLYGTNGMPTGEIVEASYTTLMAGGEVQDWRTSSHWFTNAILHRLSLLFGQSYAVNGGTEVKDLALVTLRMKTGFEEERTNRLAVLDVTIPIDPQLMTEIPISLAHGDSIWSITMREDGMLLLAGDRDVVILDPTKFNLPPPTNAHALHPAIAGVIPGAGGSMRTFAGTAGGFNLANDGTRNTLSLSAPQFRFVSFPSVVPFKPEDLIALGSAKVEETLGKAQFDEELHVARLKDSGAESPSTLNPPHQSVHYYTLISAPGSAGQTIDIALESLNRSGYPLKNRGFLFPPVRAVDPRTADDLGQRPKTYEAPVRAAKAWRLSDDPTHPNYNVYLSRPFAVVYEEVSKDDLTTLQNQLDREILWSGSFVRASFDPVMKNNDVIGPFVSGFDNSERILAPGASVIARSLPGDYIMGPNPGPVLGGVAAPAAFGAMGAHNGEVTLTPVDMTLPGRRLPLEFRRASNSQGLFEGPFGRGWDFNFNQRIVELREGVFPNGARLPLVNRADSADSEVAQQADIVFHNGAGRAVAYKYFGTTAPVEIKNDPLVIQLGWLEKAARFYTSPKGVFSVMLKMKDGRFVRLEPDGQQYWYGTDGRLEVIYDRYEKNSLQCRYNARGELVQILDELERPLDVGYWRLNGDSDYRAFVDDRTANPDIAGKISRLKDYTGRDVLFFYTEEGLLQRKEGPLVTVTGEDGFTGRQITTYFSSGTEDAAKSSQSVRGVQSGSSAGTPLFAATEIGRTSRDVATKITTAGKEVTLDMTHANSALALSQGNGKSKFVGQDKSTTEYSFDKLGRPLEVKLGKEGEPTETSSFTYNEHGLVKTITYPEGNSEEFTYDENNSSWRSRGNVLTIVKKPGPRGGPTLTASSTYDSTYNQPLTKTDYNGNQATMSLRSDKKDSETVTLGNETETYRRNEFGQLEKFTAADGVVHEFHYNSDGYLEWKQTGPNRTEYFYTGKPGQLGLPSTVRDPRHFDTTFVYDERNQVVSQDRYGYRIENSYDERGFVVKIKTAQDTGVTLTEVNTYDQLGFKLSRTEVGGVLTNLVTTYEPDDSSRVKKIVMPSGETHETTYDQAGRVTQYKVGNYVESYAYDRNGNVVTNAIGDGFEVYSYDGHDRVKTVTTPNGGTKEYDYDGNNNLKSIKVIDPIDGVISETTYEVDHRNRYKTVTRVGDSVNAVVTYEYRTATREVIMTDALGQVATTTYDEAGRLKSQDSPTRRVVFAYDGNGNLTRKESQENGRVYVEESEYNERNQLVRATDNLGHETTMVVGLDGRVLRVTDRDGHTTTNTYNALGELLSVRGPNGSVVNYTHNPNREVASVTDVNGNGISHSYDELGRLIKTRHADGSETAQSNFDNRNAPRTMNLPGGVTITSTFDKEGKVLTRDINGPMGGRVENYRHDVTGRLRRLTDPSGSVEYAYDKLGFAKTIAVEQNGFLYATSQKADGGGFRSEVTYPSGLKITDERDTTGRLKGLVPDTAPVVVANTVYAGDTLIGTRTLGSNVITSTMEYDSLKRPTARRYTRVSDGKLLAEVRYAYTAGGAQVARQFVHRAGRADFFGYDANYQLTRADMGVRPRLTSESPRAFSGFAAPAGLEGNWSAGFYAREFNYTTTDVLKNSVLVNPDGLNSFTFASTYGVPDASLHVSDIDGVTRNTDAVGNVTSGRIWVRLPGASALTAVNATFDYNDLGQLIRVNRADGVVIENRYGPGGLRIRRTVTGNASLCVPSDIGFVYDGGNLIEERDLADSNKVIARYYYGDDGDELVGGDLLDGNGQFQRFYFLSDGLRSVMAVADASGNVVERINYDAWGQPEIQPADTAAPRISRVNRDGNSLLVQFSERVLPGFVGSSSNLITTLGDVQGLFELRNLQGVIGGTIVFAETNAPFGTTFRFTPSSAIIGTVTLTMIAGAVQDEWNNPNPSESLNIDASTPPGTPLFTGPAPGSTAPTVVARSTVGASFAFQGQVFDYDAGLAYCRARFYDPSLGQFLQRDPAGYEDSVNHYAGFKNNPVNFRDATGMATDETGAWLQNIGSQASYEQDGLIGVAVGGTLQFAGAVLRLGTSTAEGLDKLEHVRPGTLGMLDIMNGAKLIAGDVAVFTAATSLGSGIGITAKRRYGSTIKAYAVSGYESARDIVAQKTGRRTGYGVASRYGFHTDETSSIHRTLLSSRQMGKEVEITIRMGSDYEKGGMRRRWVSQGLAQKRGVDWEGKSGRDARMISKFKDKKLVVSDLDIAGIKADGNLVNTKGYTWVEKNINREYSEKFRGKFGNTKRPNPPIQHHGQFQMSEQYGKMYLGHDLDLAKMQAVGHPGHTVTFRLDAKGNLLVHRTPGWSVDMDILKTELSLRKRMAELGESLPGFWALPPSWHSWK
jgi:RHS repeat-associated protein